MHLQADHCPFLNRADSRCGEHLNLDQLGHALEYCFNQYAKCPMYMELLTERRVRQATKVLRGARNQHAAREVQLTLRGQVIEHYAQDVEPEIAGKIGHSEPLHAA